MDPEKILEKLNDGSGVYFNGSLVLRRQTAFQTLEVYDTPELGRLLRIDGCNMTSERDEFFYHENLVHPALTVHPHPRTVLVIGGGDGGSCEEILKHSTIEFAHLVELDPEVIEISNSQFKAVHRGVFAHPKLKVTIGDGLAYLANPSRSYDFIALDLTDPVGPAAELYSPAFFRQCASALSQGGVLTLHIGSPIAHPLRVKENLANIRSVFPMVRPYFVHIPIYGTVWGFASASNSLDTCAITPEEVESRLKQRGVNDRQYYNGEIHRALFALPEYMKSIVA